MKKTLSFILIFSLLIIFVTGCANSNNTNNANSKENITVNRTNADISVNNTNNTNSNNSVNEIGIAEHEIEEKNEEELASFSTKLGRKGYAKNS